MATRRNNSMWVVVVILAVCLQVAFVFADGRQTATGTAIDFSKAYFLLDRDMQKYICTDLIDDDDASPVAAYLQAMNERARALGFETGMLKQMIVHLETETLAQDDTSATIHLKGLSRTHINPLYFYVARLFRLGNTYSFEKTLDLIKEDGRWKVCGTPYELPLDV